MADRHTWEAFDRVSTSGQLRFGLKFLVGLLMFFVPIALVARACSNAEAPALLKAGDKR